MTPPEPRKPAAKGHPPEDAPDSRPGRPARISRAAIARAALAIGLDAVTVKKVAGALGVDHSSLYRHVSGRADILTAAIDLALGEQDWILPATDWEDFLHQFATALWALYQTHPGLAEAMASLETTPRNGVLAFAASVRQLEAFGFTTADAALVIDSIMDMTADSVATWRRLRQRERDGRTGEQIMREGWIRHGADDPAAALPIAEIEKALSQDPHAWWSRKRDLLIAGAAMLRARQPTS